jgi:hypothetical protein
MPPSDNPIANFDADVVVEEGLDSSIYFDVAVSWAAQDMHTAYDAPTGVFE